MKILRIYKRLPPFQGGMEKHISELTKYQNFSNEITLYFNSGNYISDRDEKIFPKFKTIGLKSSFPFVFVFYLAAITKLLQNKKKFDIIHLHGDWSSFIFAPILKGLTKAKVICFSMHGSIKSHSTWQKKILKYSLKSADIVFSTGFENHEWLKPFCKKAVFQPSGVSDVFFNQINPVFTEKKSFRIVTVGNLFPVKNTKMIIQIAAVLSEMEFIIIGNGPEYSCLKEMTDSLNCRNVIFKGDLSKEEIKDELLKSNLFLFSSILEGTPTAVMEAMTCGLPIITSNAGKVESIVTNGVNGFVIQDYDIDKYIFKIIELYNDTELCRIISNNNKEKAKQFSWNKVASLITNHQVECLNFKIYN